MKLFYITVAIVNTYGSNIFTMKIYIPLWIHLFKAGGESIKNVVMEMRGFAEALQQANWSDFYVFV